MTFQEFKNLIAPLAVQLGAEYDLPTWKLYHRALSNIPLPLFSAAVEEAAMTWKSTSKFPSAAHLRGFAEAQRQKLLKANPYDGCADCEDHRGWIETEIEGVKRMAVCGCKRRWMAKLEGLGVTSQPLSSFEESADVRLLAAGE